MKLIFFILLIHIPFGVSQLLASVADIVPKLTSVLPKLQASVSVVSGLNVNISQPISDGVLSSAVSGAPKVLSSLSSVISEVISQAPLVSLPNVQPITPAVNVSVTVDASVKSGAQVSAAASNAVSSLPKIISSLDTKILSTAAVAKLVSTPITSVRTSIDRLARTDVMYGEIPDWR